MLPVMHAHGIICILEWGNNCKQPCWKSILKRLGILQQTHIQHVCEQAHALQQARKAGAQAGWGFAKAHTSWPKPDIKASSTLGPLRMVRSACNVSLLFVLDNTWQVTHKCCLHVVCHSYSCTAMCTAWMLTGHRAIALPQAGVLVVPVQQ